MTSLRNQMIEAMTVRGFSPRTHQSYLQAVKGLVKYYHRSPAQLTKEQIKRYFVYLPQSEGSPGQAVAWHSMPSAFSTCRYCSGRALTWISQHPRASNGYLSY